MIVDAHNHIFPPLAGACEYLSEAELHPTLKRLYDLAGPGLLVWGSDMPNVERNCTYRQSLDYLRQGLAGIASTRELDAILGGNVRRVLGVSPYDGVGADGRRSR